ncbi:heterokaryon incompatibility protein-domain-containing protein, partial [Bisporella sp. PMI_857]
MFPVFRKWVSLYFTPVPRPEVQSYMATYKYGRLPPNTKSFRVFHLFPQRPEDQTPGGDLSGILRGRIEVMNIDEGCRYNALSYCWEGSIDPSPYTRQRKDRILIEESDGSLSQLLISPALSTALRYLRSRGQSLPLFVDQVCINQRDKSDKSQQISLMGDIYRNCVCVVAWLDVATKYTDALFDFLPRISGNELLLQLIQQPQRLSRILEATMEKRTNFSDSEMLGQDVKNMVELTREHWGRFPQRGFLDICLRRWFRRIWIIQEACLGPNMIFVCGRRSCSVNALEVASHFRMLASSGQHLEEGSPLEHHQAKWDKEAIHNALNGTTVVFRIFRERAAALRPSLEEQSVMMRRGLANLVTRFNVDIMVHGPWVRLGFSNPKDTIYALRGLVSDGDPVSERLVTDYNLPAATIFTDFTRLLFDASIGTPPIDTLLLSQMETKRIHGLPSWVPDWSVNIVIPHGYRSGCFPMFNAGGGNREPYVYPEVDVSSPGILSVKAILLCEIDRVGTHFMELSSRRLAHPMESPTLLPRSIFRFFREVRELCEWASEQPNSVSIPSTAKLDEAVWVTTTGGHGFTQTTERSLLGTQIVDGKPLLGYLWDFQLQME